MRLISFWSIAVFTSCVASAEGPVFDAASVRLTGPEVQQLFPITGGPGTSDTGRFRAPRINMINLLAKAFDVREDQITGPAWLRDLASANDYTIVATMPPGTTNAQFQKMLQNLLSERFHLVFHHETRNFPGYALVVDKGGPKFKEVVPTEAAKPDQAPDSGDAWRKRGADGFPTLTGPRTVTNLGRGQRRTKYQERTMAEFVFNLGFLIGSAQGRDVLQGFPQPRVVDRTGLTGKYTFILEYSDASRARLLANLPVFAGNSDRDNATQAVASEPDSGLPNIFVAIQKELGLRLDKTADVPVDIIVVDSVAKVPTEN
jgi:uncharacterized protein (TIGR03435 family)